MVRTFLFLYSLLPSEIPIALIIRSLTSLAIIASSGIGSYIAGIHNQSDRNWNASYIVSPSPEVVTALRTAYEGRQASSIAIYGYDYRIPNLTPLWGLPSKPLASQYVSKSADSEFIAHFRSQCWLDVSHETEHSNQIKISCPIQGKLSLPLGAIVMKFDRPLNTGEARDIQDQLADLGRFTVSGQQ